MVSVLSLAVAPLLLLCNTLLLLAVVVADIIWLALAAAAVY
jgi:hypothetical protein